MLSIFRNKKVVLILCVLFLGIVILGICFGYSFNINQRFVKNMTRDKSLGNANYIAKDEEYIFQYKKAYPWDFSCFASVCNEESTKVYLQDDGTIKTNGMGITLYIWPSSKEYEYGVYLSENDSEYIDLQLNINENIENISKNKDTYADEILEKYKEEIEQLMEAAKEKWNL